MSMNEQMNNINRQVDKTVENFSSEKKEEERKQKELDEKILNDKEKEQMRKLEKQEKFSKVGQALNTADFTTGAATAVIAPDPLSKSLGGIKVATASYSIDKSNEKLAGIAESKNDLRQQAIDRYNKASELKPSLADIEKNNMQNSMQEDRQKG